MSEVSRTTGALVGGVVALTGALAVAAADNAFTLGEVVVSVAAAAAAVGAWFGVTRTGTPAESETTGEHEALPPGT